MGNQRNDFNTLKIASTPYLIGDVSYLEGWVLCGINVVLCRLMS
jgi:hypothetical protein